METVLVSNRKPRRSRLARWLRITWLRALKNPTPMIDRLVPEDRYGYGHVTIRL
jgi:hypothetical protein